MMATMTPAIRPPICHLNAGWALDSFFGAPFFTVDFLVEAGFAMVLSLYPVSLYFFLKATQASRLHLVGRISVVGNGRCSQWGTPFVCQFLPPPAIKGAACFYSQPERAALSQFLHDPCCRGAVFRKQLPAGAPVPSFGAVVFSETAFVKAVPTR